MKQIFLTLAVVAMALSPLKAQFSVMFVDDSKDTFGNAELFASSLDSLGVSYLYFNAQDSAASPVDTLMAKYDLVIWHTSNEGSGDPLYLWNALDEDNGNLISYLNGGGNLWLVGLDFMFDKYGAAPDTFAAGEFVYDYLGMSSYDVQSYGDDGNLGVPYVYPDTSVVAGLDTLDFIFSTVWWADGVTPVDSAKAVYKMGDPGYVFYEKPTGILYESDSFKTMTFFFDLSLASDFSLIKSTTAAAIEYFSFVDTTTNTGLEDIVSQSLNVFPNPSTGQLSMEVELTNTVAGQVTLLNLQGQVLEVLLPSRTLTAGPHRFDWTLSSRLPQGLYLLKLDLGENSATKMVELR